MAGRYTVLMLGVLFRYSHRGGSVLKNERCPFHVRQGVVAKDGGFMITDVCGVKSACGASCRFAPFESASFKGCAFYVEQQRGANRHVMVPKGDIEYLPEVGGFSGLSDLELM